MQDFRNLAKGLRKVVNLIVNENEYFMRNYNNGWIIEIKLEFIECA